MLSINDQTYLCHAAHESTKSTLPSRHGAIAVVNGRIMGRGHNSDRTQSQDGLFMIHAHVMRRSRHCVICGTPAAQIHMENIANR